MAENSVTGKIVIIEWDGRVPPTAYYHRLRKLTGGVRGSGDKDTSVIGRRSETLHNNEVTGLILQEGAIVTPSDSLARVIAGLATRYGARDVHVGDVNLRTFTELTDGDREVMKRVDEAFGRRGRPPKPINWMVTCIEDMQSFFVENASFVPNCALCGGLNIIAYPSKSPLLYKYVVERGGKKSLINEWIVTRFGSGLFTLPMEGASYRTYETVNTEDITNGFASLGREPTNDLSAVGKCVTTVKIKDEQDEQIVNRIKDSTLIDTLEHKSGVSGRAHREAVVALDGLFASLRYITESDRQDARIKAITRIMSQGYRGNIAFSSDPDSIDLLDAAGVFTPDRMTAMFHTLIA